VTTNPLHRANFEEEVRAVINRYSMENDSDTPDFILAQFVRGCLDNFAIATCRRDEWFGFQPWKKKL
jgi:hypothetical protein